MPGYMNTDSSLLVAPANADVSTSTRSAWPVATFGLIYSCAGFLNAGAALPGATGIDQLMCVGEFQGAGFVQSVAINALTTTVTTPSTYLATDNGVLVIPSGGVVNFKGTTSTGDYVLQKCTSIAPHYQADYL